MLGRRRKIRCIFQSDNPDVCSECFARGSRCIDQESANPDVIVDHRKNLRERVSRLEALVDSLLEDKTVKSESPSHESRAETASPRNVYTKDTFPPTPLSSEASSNILRDSQRVPSTSARHHIPILSVFEDAVSLLPFVDLALLTSTAQRCRREDQGSYGHPAQALAPTTK